MHLWLLIKDAWHAQSWWDKLRIWLMPLGWRPMDVAKKFPIYKIEDPFHFEKYNPGNLKSLIAWSWAQMTFVLLFISYLFGNIARIGAPDMFVYGVFVFLSVYAYSELLDNNPNAYVWELIKNAFGLSILIYTADWFGALEILPGIHYFIYCYFAISSIVTVGFCLHLQRKQVVPTDKI